MQLRLLAALLAVSAMAQSPAPLLIPDVERVVALQTALRLANAATKQATAETLFFSGLTDQQKRQYQDMLAAQQKTEAARLALQSKEARLHAICGAGSVQWEPELACKAQAKDSAPESKAR
jgi:hypothetical protein